MPIYTYVQILTSFVDKFYFRTFFRPCVQQINTSATSSLFRGAVLSGYITILKNKQKLDVSSEGPSSRVNEGPSLETSSFCLFFKVVI